MKSGIYRIRNVKNNMQYIGSTNNFSRREKEHFKALREGRHQVRLQLAWDAEDDKSVFCFEPLVIYPLENLVELEQRFIDTLTPEYNLNPLATGMGNFYYKLDEKERSLFSNKCSQSADRRWSKPTAKDDFSKLMTTINNQPAVAEKRTKAIAETLGYRVKNITTGEVFPSMNQARISHNLKSSRAIKNCCDGRTNFVKATGHVWRYVDEFEVIVEPEKKPKRTAYERSEVSKRRHAKRSKNESSQIGKKAWETRIKNKSKLLSNPTFNQKIGAAYSNFIRSVSYWGA